MRRYISHDIHGLPEHVGRRVVGGGVSTLLLCPVFGDAFMHTDGTIRYYLARQDSHR